MDDAPIVRPDAVDLVVVGGPTEQHGMTDPMTRYLGRLTSHALDGAVAAAFDTRLRWPRWMSGSAATGIEAELRRSGARLVAPAESFFVTMKPALVSGEQSRAEAWAETLAEAVELAVGGDGSAAS